MEVQGPSSIGGSVPISHVRPKANVEQLPPPGTMSPRDEVDISSVGKLMNDASQTPGIRQERLAQIKAAIDAGTYDTTEKFELALSRLIEQVQRDE